LDYYDLEKVKKSDVEESFKTTSIGYLMTYTYTFEKINRKITLVDFKRK